MRVSYLKDGFNKNPSVIEIDEAVSMIKSGSNGLEQQTLRIRKLTGETRQKAKRYLPTIMPCGIFVDGKQDQHVTSHTGLLVFDYDKDIGQLSQFRQQLIEGPFSESLVLLFISPSGNGLKAIYRLDGVPQIEEHKLVYDNVAGRLPKGWAGAQDNISRLCYLCYDPDVYFNPAAQGITWEIIRKKHKPKYMRNRPKKSNGLPSEVFYEQYNYEDLLTRIGLTKSYQAGGWDTYKWQGVASQNACSVNGKAIHIWSDTVNDRWRECKNKNGNPDAFKIYCLEIHNIIINSYDTWKKAQIATADDGYGQWQTHTHYPQNHYFGNTSFNSSFNSSIRTHKFKGTFR